MPITPTEADKAIQKCIDARKSFVLDAGAGSGKTTSLIEALKLILSGPVGAELRKTSQKLACITFTNVAKDEILERTGDNTLLHVSTIHDFLWTVIQPHQKALKRALLEHNNALKPESSRKCDPKELAEALGKVTIAYSDRGANFFEGRIFHDDLIHLAFLLFKANPLAAKILGSRYPVIFVDEYQDTSASVIAILLDHILPSNAGRLVIGFFGDKFQSIYHGGEHPGVGEIPGDKRGGLTYITKTENYRCPESVIAVLNEIRTDIKQTPAGKNVQGAAVYLHCSQVDAGNVLGKAKAFIQEKLKWDVIGGSQKELFLTHKLIAGQLGYRTLLDVYKERSELLLERLLKGEDKYVSFFRKSVEPLVVAWQGRRIGTTLSLLRAGGFKLNERNGKTRAKEALNKLLELRQKGTVREIVEHVAKTGLLSPLDDLRKALEITSQQAQTVPDELRSLGEEDEMRARELKDLLFLYKLVTLPYSEIMGCCRFLEQNAAFSTKHGVKGAEFDTVFVVLDDKGARWNVYSFDKYLNGEDEVEGKLERITKTRNLFYVCCSRAKKQLAVVDFGSRSSAKSARLAKLFGAKNCYSL